jgi:hypothetical protein
MEQWWVRHKDVAMGDYQRSEVEDITGCIPLLLDKCVVGGKIDLTVADLRDIHDEAVGHVRRVKSSTKEKPEDWDLYV